MQPIKVCVVEDDVIIADSLCAMLEELGYAVAEPAGNYDAALRMVESEQPDIMLLDINLGKGPDGIDIAHYLRHHYNIPFIFLTANSDRVTVERAKQCRPNAYLVKPFQKNNLYTAIEIAFYSFNEKIVSADEQVSAANDLLQPEALFIKEGVYFHKIKFGDILYLSSEHVYVTVHTLQQKKFLVRTSMQQYLGKFDSEKFVRVHRSYAVNIDAIEKINTTCLFLAGNKIPVSKNYHDELLSRFKRNSCSAGK